MRRGLTILAGAILAFTAIPSTASATAPTRESLTLRGFPTMVSKLSASQKATIDDFVSANDGIESLRCTGYTGYNYLGVSSAEIVTLAKDRARNSCKYAATAAGLESWTIRWVATDSESSRSRRVIIRAVIATAGTYTYAFDGLDDGSVQSGGAPTTVSRGGDTVASTFADGTPLSGPPTYGYAGDSLGSAGYFDHWNTRADGTGTSYYLGDVLPDAPAGTVVVLYGILSFG